MAAILMDIKNVIKKIIKNKCHIFKQIVEIILISVSYLLMWWALEILTYIININIIN